MSNLFALTIALLAFQGSQERLKDFGEITHNGSLAVGELGDKTNPVRVYLPDDMRAGDQISGTVVAPEGQKVELPDGRTVSPGPFRLKIPFRASAVWMEFALGGKPRARKAIFTLPVRSSALPPSKFSCGPIAKRNVPFSIHGPFDGDASNTKVGTSVLDVAVLAESPRQAVCLFPGIVNGEFPFRVQEGGTIQELRARIVSVRLSIDKPVMRFDETANLEIAVSGLSEAKEAGFPCTLANLNPAIIAVQGGEVQSLSIAPSKADATGTWRTKVPIKGRKPGKYELELEFPEGLSSGADEDAYPPELIWTQIEPVSSQSLQYRLRASARSGGSSAPLEVVRFQYREIGSSSWQPCAPTQQTLATYTSEARFPFSSLYEVRVEGAGGDGATVSSSRFVRAGNPDLPFGGSRSLDRLADYAAFRVESRKMVEAMNASFDLASSYTSLAEEHRKQARKEEDEARALRSEAERKRKQAEALEKLDKVLEGRSPAILEELKRLAEQIRQIEAGIGANTTKEELQKKADAIAQDVDDCKKHCADLEKQRADLEAENKKLETELKDLAKEVNTLFGNDGWTGSARYDSEAGIIRWGFVSDGGSPRALSNWGSPESNRLEQIRKDKNAKQKQLKANRQRIQELDDEIESCKKACEEKEKKAQEAQKAVEQANAKAAAEAQMGAKCAEIDAILGRIKKFLDKNKDIDPELKKQLEELVSKCPKIPEEVEKLKNGLAALMSAKAAEEKHLKDAANDDDSNAQAHEDAAKAEREAARAAEEAAAKAAADAAKAERDRLAEEAARIKQAEEAKRKSNAAAAKLAKEMEDAFKKWLDDCVKRGLLDDDDLEEILAKLTDLAGGLGSAIAEAAKTAAKGASSGGIARAGLFEGIFQIYSMLFYWWIEHELRGAIERLRPAFNEKEFNEILLLLELRKSKPYGVIEHGSNKGKTYFYYRKGNRIFVFRVERGRGIELIGVQ